jgi:hypothetical protein
LKRESKVPEIDNKEFYLCFTKHIIILE